MSVKSFDNATPKRGGTSAADAVRERCRRGKVSRLETGRGGGGVGFPTPLPLRYGETNRGCSLLRPSETPGHGGTSAAEVVLLEKEGHKA